MELHVSQRMYLKGVGNLLSFGLVLPWGCMVSLPLSFILQTFLKEVRGQTVQLK